MGRLVLLSAPRAGYGKTHLLKRLEEGDRNEHFSIPVIFNFERSVSWNACADQVLRYCHITSGHASGVSRLSEIARRLFANLNADLLRRGLVQCEGDQEAILRDLELRAVEIYQLAEDSSSLGQWFLRNFELLLPELSESLAVRAGLTVESAGEWLRVLCAYEQGQNDSAAARWQSLQWGIRQISQTMQGGFADGVQVLSVTAEGEQLSAKDRLVEFLRLTGVVKLPVITVDEMDVLYRDIAACLRLADVLAQIAAKVSRSLVILSANDDVWDKGFRYHLPSAVVDRLTGSMVRLRGLAFNEVEALVRSRLEEVDLSPSDITRFVRTTDLAQWVENGGAQISPRAVIRYCAARWDTFGAAESGAGLMAAAAPPSLFPSGDPKLAPAPRATQKRPAVGLAPLKPIVASPAVEPQKSTGGDKLRAAFEARLGELSETFELDPVRIASLLRIAGQQFPMVRYDEESVSSGNGVPPSLVGVWHTGDSELLFGLRPYSEIAYWKSLVRYMESRGMSTSKLAVFDSTGREHVSSILAEGGESHVDVVELDHSAVRRLSAASDLLDDAERGVLDVPVPQALAGIVDELDFFWKRVTRSR
ncbi:MAG: hypothetical protein KDN22_17260 [Verrucomicrobiae bacterium]|nr:hypothetical protein [Verrucomicrobiae bacterium]